ncbi:MAG: T9SS type A sorting domain-containing protein, partial [candidate division WOR-3 bacterium]
YLIPSGFDKFSLKIYDINGRCIRDLSKFLLKGKENKIVINNLSKGVYFIKFKAGEYRKDLKVIKVR